MIVSTLMFVGVQDFGCQAFRSWDTHIIAGAVVLLTTLLIGLSTDYRVALIGLAIAPIVVLVVLITTLAEILIAVPDRISWAVHVHPVGSGPSPAPTMIRALKY